MTTHNDGSKASTEASTVECAYLARGFTIEHTGGGCMAFSRWTSPTRGVASEMLVSDISGACLPDTMDAPVVVQITDCAGDWFTLNFASSTAFLASLQD